MLLLLQMRGKLECPWPDEQDRDMLVFKAWTSTGKIIAVWQSLEHTEAPKEPIVWVFDAIVCKLERTIPLPIPFGPVPWEGTDGQFHLRDFALSSSHDLLAVAVADLDTISYNLVWIVDLQSGNVEFAKAFDGRSRVGSHAKMGMLAFSADGSALAMVSGGENGIGPMSGLQLLTVSPMSLITRTRLTGQQAFPAPHDTTFILPRYRMVLFVDRINTDDGKSDILYHIPAACAGMKFVEQHRHASPPTQPWTDDISTDDSPVDGKSCTICSSWTLDGGSLSPCGALFVALGSVGLDAQHVVLEHWLIDHEKSCCSPRIVQEVKLAMNHLGVSSSFERDSPSLKEELHSHVAWYPLFVGRLLYSRCQGGYRHGAHHRRPHSCCPACC